MIDNEKDLDRVFAKEMRRKNSTVWKVENSALTGMADFYCRHKQAGDRKGIVLWVENKVVKDEDNAISYRPGQQKFLSENFDIGIVHSYTLIYNKNNKCFYIIDGYNAYDVSLVTDELVHEFTSIKEVVKWLLSY